MKTKKRKSNELPVAHHKAMIETLKTRFEKNTQRHEGVAWATVEATLMEQSDKMWSLSEMERTGGEPDVVGRDEATGALVFVDCAPETPKLRRSVCYDALALAFRKEHKPAHSAVGMAEEMGVELLTEDEYRDLQRVGRFDGKTSSWLKTPEEIREKGGAIFGDYRFGRVFVYHNGAESYYGVRGFRGRLPA